jgi:hypothetical protein
MSAKPITLYRPEGIVATGIDLNPFQEAMENLAKEASLLRGQGLEVAISEDWSHNLKATIKDKVFEVEYKRESK